MCLALCQGAPTDSQADLELGGHWEASPNTSNLGFDASNRMLERKLEDTACRRTSDQLNKMVDSVTDDVNPIVYLISDITDEDRGIISSWP